MRFRVAAVAIAVLVCLAPLPAHRAALPASPAPSVANPTVIGPIPLTTAPGDPSHGYPFFATNIDLASQGYVEEEFFFEGTANRYDFPPAVSALSTPMTTANVIASAPYRTRMIVRRPASAAQFDGTVVMEWLNVTAFYDLDACWLSGHESMLRRGRAWIGVSAQRAGIHTPVTGLRAWSPARYGTLDVTANGTVNDDSLEYDIFSQAGQAVKNPVGVDPMAGLKVERILAMGASQSASRLVGYHNAVHPSAGVFDGFMPYLHGGRLRTDLAVKVFKVLTETDVWREQALLRQENSDHFRRWEVAGAAHIDYDLARATKPISLRDLGAGSPVQCARPTLSRIPFRYVAAAAAEAMVRWLRDNIEPPQAPDIEVTTVAQWATIARDQFGNALGGIRLSQHAVPTATNTGENYPVDGYCRMYGSYVPFSAQTLAMLYPNHGTYVSRVARVTNENLAAGYISAEDAEATIREAAESNVGKPARPVASAGMSRMRR